ncbi:MAG: condensation domain-containing protein, partial [Psychrosphaera sp.]|nr:condensation domain-containing protein [Psychrosphaera sp.]
IDNSQNKTPRSPVICVKRDSNTLPASFAQQRLWFIDQMDGSSEQYNMFGALRFTGDFVEDIAEQAFARIVERHEPLRTVFIDSSNGVQQLIRETVEFKINRIDVTNLADVEQAVQQDARLPFDLANDIMLRIGVIRLSKGEGVMLFNMHHIASDGWSMGLLANEFTRQYQAISNNQPNPFEPLAIQYADYALWQRDFLSGDKLESQLTYWTEQLDGLAQVHSLPLDHARPKIQTFNGKQASFEVDKLTLAKLENIALDNKATLFMLLHGAFSVLLSRHASSHDIVIGVPVANRLQKELEQIIGFFVNTLVLRTDSSNSSSFTEFLQHVKQVNLDAQAN